MLKTTPTFPGVMTVNELRTAVTRITATPPATNHPTTSGIPDHVRCSFAKLSLSQSVTPGNRTASAFRRTEGPRVDLPWERPGSVPR